MSRPRAPAMDRLPEQVPVSDSVLDILTRLEQAGHETWCVGGAIRDTLLGDVHQDVDLATAAPPAEVQRLFRRTVPVGIEHGTVGVLDETNVLHEVTTFRRDVRTDGRHAVVEFGTSLDEDLARRDFTINAIAFHPLRRTWRDPRGGFADLRAGVIRAVGDPDTRFREDRLRMLRALRFAARLDFAIDPPTWRAIVAQATDTAHLSAERVRDEWIKGIATARSLDTLVGLWRDSGIAAVWLPECRPSPAHDAAWFDRVGDVRDAVLLTAGWCMPSAPVWRRFKGSAAEIRRADAIDRGPAAPVSDDPVRVRHWMATVGAAVDDLQALARWTEPGAAWIAVVDGVRARHEPTARRDLAVSGGDLAAAGIVPGPAMGRVLTRLLDAVLDDPQLNTRDALLALAAATRP